MMMKTTWKRILIMVLMMRNRVPGTKAKRIIKKQKQCRRKINIVRINHTIQEMAGLQVSQSQKDSLCWQIKPKCLILQIKSLKKAVFSVLVKRSKENFLQFNPANLRHGWENSFLADSNVALMQTKKSKTSSMIKKKLRPTANSQHANRCSPIKKIPKVESLFHKNLQLRIQKRIN